jgi:hypothetical protein
VNLNQEVILGIVVGMSVNVYLFIRIYRARQRRLEVRGRRFRPMTPSLDVPAVVRAAAAALRAASPDFGCCNRCGMPWSVVEGHSTQWDEHNGCGCFPLCESCWAELTPETRVPFYEHLIREWAWLDDAPVDEERRRQILQAVAEGK